MCEFISWKEFDGGDVLFLTAKDIYETKRGRELREHSGSKDDLTGHGSIDFYYDLKGKGKNKECIDFSSPDNFPQAIVKAIKAGEFRGLGIAKDLLKAPAWAEYRKRESLALAKYQKREAPAWAKYGKVRDAEYRKVKDSAWAKYEKVRATAWAECEKVTSKTFWDLFAVEENRAKKWR